MNTDYFQKEREIVGFSLNENHVQGHLFNEKNMYSGEVLIDYTGNNLSEENIWDAARSALARATRKGISGVGFEELPRDWTMVVMHPQGKNTRPILVYRGYKP